MKKISVMLENEDGKMEAVKISENTRKAIKTVIKYSPLIIIALIAFQLLVSVAQSYIYKDYNYFAFSLLASALESILFIIFFAYVKIKNHKATKES